MGFSIEKQEDFTCTQDLLHNDVLQSYAAVVVAAIIAATNIAKIKLQEQHIVLLGNNNLSLCIATQLTHYMKSLGLDEQGIREKLYVLHQTESQQNTNQINLIDVIDHVKPSILLGLSNQSHAFNETLIRKIAKYCARPIIFPLSTPLTNTEAVPIDLFAWTSGNALIATGCLFNPVSLNNKDIAISQCDDVYILPSIKLAMFIGNIRNITPDLLMRASITLSELAPALKTGIGRLLPDIINIKDVCQKVTKACYLQASASDNADFIDASQIDQIINQQYENLKTRELL